VSAPVRLAITVRDPGARVVRFAVRVQPRASRAGVAGLHGAALKVGVHAPPVDGAANAAVIDVIAAALGISKRMVQIVGGHASRSKIVETHGLTPAEVQARLFG
jgi:uncharacterized protein